jgi:hypothetical protein
MRVHRIVECYNLTAYVLRTFRHDEQDLLGLTYVSEQDNDKY